MKIRFNNGAVQTARGDVGILFVAAGLAQEVFDVAPKPIIPTVWGAGTVMETGEAYIIATCQNGLCASSHNTHRAFGPNATKTLFYHCGKGESCPPEIAKKFESLRAGAEED